MIGALILTFSLSSANPWRIFVFWLGLQSLSIAINTSIPRRSGRLWRDGYHLRVLLRRDAQTERFVEMQTWYHLLISPERPRDWPESLVQQANQRAETWTPPVDDPLMLDDGPIVAEVLWYHHMDLGNPVGATVFLTRIIETPWMRTPENSDASAALQVFHAITHVVAAGDPAIARETLEQIPPQAAIRKNSLWVTAWAAIAAAEGDIDATRDSVNQAIRRQERTWINAGSDRLERQWLDGFVKRAELDQQPTTTHVEATAA